MQWLESKSQKPMVVTIDVSNGLPMPKVQFRVTYLTLQFSCQRSEDLGTGLQADGANKLRVLKL